MKVTLLSDTHTKHNNIITSKSLRNSNQPLDLPGGDLLIHAGDFMNSGYDKTDVFEFFEWFDAIDNYDEKIFIAGNHDRIMQNEPEWVQGILTGYQTIDYLQDSSVKLYFDGPNGDFPEDNVAIYGSPWQPEFHNWAFNLPRNSEELKAKWDAIPLDTKILITHGPAFGYQDIPGGQSIRVGCEMLRYRIDEIKPMIHVCGHIHGGYGYYFNGHTHCFNASILDERYNYTNKPFHFEWDQATNEIQFI